MDGTDTVENGNCMKKPVLYKKGDIVKHKAAFLRNTGWFTGVPVDGLVVENQQATDDLVRVQWCDAEEAVGILSANILLSGTPDHS